MNRFYIETDLSFPRKRESRNTLDPRLKHSGMTDDQIILSDPAQVHHLKNVLRIKVGESVVLFDKTENEYLALVDEVQPKIVKLLIKERKVAEGSGIKITVACAIPKNVKMDDIVDKLTQLGVECIIPLETERVIVRLNKQKKLERRERWEKISLSALKQSQRSKFVKIEPITEFKDLVSAAHNFDLKLIATFYGETKSLKSVLECHCEGKARSNHDFKGGIASPSARNDNKRVRNILISIGPEGDFTPDEVNLAKKSGFLPVDLGRGVLRVDTAAIAVVSFIKLNEAY